jgi:large subunit ribosomal protein L11
MAKTPIAEVKIQLPAGGATPAPPVAPALGPHGINLAEFCKAFNAQTSSQTGMTIPAVVTIYNDRSFSFITKTPPAANLIIKTLGIAKGSGVPNREKVGKIKKSQLVEIYEIKAADLNAYDAEQGVKIIAGTARSMGVDVDWTA